MTTNPGGINDRQLAKLVDDARIILKAPPNFTSVWTSVLSNFQRLGKFSSGNSVDLYEGGDSVFPKMIQAIENAKTRVWLETYIFDDSEAARKFSIALAEASNSCDVVVLVDWVGSLAKMTKSFEILENSKVNLIFFNSLIPTDSCGPAFYRDHRKILVCDDVGFLGGMNIAKENCHEFGGDGAFYDLHLKVRGPCVNHLAEVFCSSLEESKQGVSRDPFYPETVVKNGMYVQVLESNVRAGRRHIQEVYRTCLQNALSSVVLGSAYFLPPTFLRRSLLSCADRNIPVSILLSGESDLYPIPLDLLAQFHVIQKMLLHSKPIQIGLYEKEHMHAKFITFDHVFSCLGSMNCDRYSTRRNLEVSLGVFDTRFSKRLEEVHSRKFRESKILQKPPDIWPLNSFWGRQISSLSYFLVLLTSKNMIDGLNCYKDRWLVRRKNLNEIIDAQAGVLTATGMLWGS